MFRLNLILIIISHVLRFLTAFEMTIKCHCDPNALGEAIPQEEKHKISGLQASFSIKVSH